MGPDRILEGQEKDEVWMILKFLDVGHSTNNQLVITEHYTYGNAHYKVTFFDKNEYEIIEILR
jgi:DNA-directed RNA polymerase subunit E'/Rpb7